MHVKIDDKEVMTKIMEKNEAWEKYDDAIASGNSAAKMEQNEDLPDILSLGLGNIKAGKKAVVTITIVNKLSTVSDEFYNFTFPVQYIPKYKAAGSAKKSGNYLNGEFGITINLKASDEIHFIDSKSKLAVKEISPKHFELKIPTQKDFKAKDIHVAFRTSALKKPMIVMRESDKYPDEVAAMISFIPNSKVKSEEEEK